MTRRMRFFINGAWLTAVALAMRTVGLLFGAYVSRTVGAEGVGLFTLIMTVFAFASTFATAGIGLAVTRLVAAIIGEGREGPGAVLRGAALYAAFFGGTATICLLLLSEPVCLYILKDARAIEPLRVLALSLLPTALGAVFSGYFVGVRKVGYNGALGIFSQIVRVGLTLVLILRSNSPEDAVLALC